MEWWQCAGAGSIRGMAQLSARWVVQDSRDQTVASFRVHFSISMYTFYIITSMYIYNDTYIPYVFL